ncbi:MAG: GTP-binding protein [Patescibacteria group bacterium]|nr:GTP-binding protein [Patescibacteria group bacterium]
MTHSENKNLKPRSPVVVVMGHVDHGKTTLLDYIRKANVADKEAGGITQAVGAYEISHSSAGSEHIQKITFIDTPGHEAFIAMRSRGVAIADLAVLVIAGDEGIKPQTKEAIEIIRKSETPFVVAITKTDKPAANIDKIKNELAEAGVLLEGYGGQTSWHGVSAKTGEGVNDLLDLILLAAEVEGLTYDPSAPASGFILEARKDKRRGIEAIAIIKNGTLRRGDEIRTPTVSGRVKILEDFLGRAVPSIEASSPARIIGFETIPAVGEPLQTKDEQFPDQEKISVQRLARAGRFDDEDEVHILRVMLKAGDAGSLEALSKVVKGIPSKEMAIEIVSESVGDITDGDVRDAIATNATIAGFKVKLEKGAANLVEAQHVRVVLSDIVYDLLKSLEEFVRVAGKPAILGVIEVLAVFNKEKLDKQLVGGRVIEGSFRSKGMCEIVRMENDVEKNVGTGKITNLRDKKSDVTQAEKGKEAGVCISSSIEIQKGDKLVIREKR